MFSVLLVVFSCSKDDDQVEFFKISKITYGEVIGLGTYKANYASNKLAKLASNTEIIQFEYSENGTILKREFVNINDSQVTYRSIYTTNNSGQIIDIKNWRFENNEMRYLGKQTYEYQNSKLSNIFYYGEDNISIYNTLELIWDGQNPILINWVGQDGIPDYTTHVSYDMSKKNKFNSTFIHSALLYAFNSDFLIWQSLSDNTPISSETYYNGSSETIQYQYSLLNNGLTSEIYYNNELWIKYEYE